MPKEKPSKSMSSQLRHEPLGTIMEKPTGKLRIPKDGKAKKDVENEEDDEEGMDNVPTSLGTKIYNQAKEQRREMLACNSNNSSSSGSLNRHAKPTSGGLKKKKTNDDDGGDDDDDDDVDDEDDDDDDGDYEEIEDDDRGGEDEMEDDQDDDESDSMVEFDGEFVTGAGLSAEEEAVVQKFLQAGRAETRTLADIIMDKIKEKESDAINMMVDGGDGGSQNDLRIPPKVLEVYTSLGKMLAHYKAGKLPKALKMLPHLKNWEDVLWLTRPDEWSPSATYACTRIFASNLNEKMAQRFYNVVLLEKCRDDIRSQNKLNYHYYMALKKALFKPAAFYKGVLLPLAQSRTCTLREAAIVGSVLAKVSVPGNHSAAALLRLAEMPYSGSTSTFIRVLLHKKYALPRRVVDALVTHFCAFEKEALALPVIWHQSLLTFVERYKFELDDGQRDRLRALVKVQHHHQIALEVKRELAASAASSS